MAQTPGGSPPWLVVSLKRIPKLETGQESCDGRYVAVAFGLVGKTDMEFSSTGLCGVPTCVRHPAMKEEMKMSLSLPLSSLEFCGFFSVVDLHVALLLVL